NGNVAASNNQGAVILSPSGQLLSSVDFRCGAAPVALPHGQVMLMGRSDQLAFVSAKGTVNRILSYGLSGSLWGGAIVLSPHVIAVTYEDVSSENSHVMLIDDLGNEKSRTDLLPFGDFTMRKLSSSSVVVADKLRGVVHVLSCRP